MKRLLCIFSFFFMMAAFSVEAASPVKVSLIAEKEGVMPQEELFLALKFDMPEGWHVYWKNAGDAGEATDLKLTLPKGFSEVERLWPFPERFTIGDLAEYGYRGPAYLLVKIKSPAELPLNEKFEIKGHVTFLACKDECVPSSADVSLFLTSGLESSFPQKEFGKILSSIPEKKEGAYVEFWELSENYVLGFPFEKEADKAYFFPENGLIIFHAGTQELQSKEDKSYLFIPRISGDIREKSDDKLSGTLVLYKKSGQVLKSYDIKASLASTPLSDFSDSFEFSGFWIALLFAFSGGVFLNLMPCVFPVLSLKAFSILAQGNSCSSKEKRQESLAYTSGVLFSFLGIGALLILLRDAGAEIGWGFQLQYPPFVFLLILFIFFLALIFSDVLTVGTRFSGCGSDRKWGNFGTGVLAVFIATPCAAPFMGAALGYGLISPAPVTMAVFLTMGLGLSLPFLILGFFPAVAAVLPKPGAWMELFRQFLAFPLYATAGWLLWVLAAQGGSLALAYGVIGLVLTGLSAWLYGKSHYHPGLRNWARVSILITLFAAGTFTYELRPVSPQAAVEKIHWQPYQVEVVESYRKQGVPVFIKFSASWCLTCLMNDRITLETQAVSELFRSKGVVAFFGDWTTRNDAITKALEYYGRGGIPLYVYYAPYAEKPVLLPQIITEHTIESILQEL